MPKKYTSIMLDRTDQTVQAAVFRRHCDALRPDRFDHAFALTLCASLFWVSELRAMRSCMCRCLHERQRERDKKAVTTAAAQWKKFNSMTVHFLCLSIITPKNQIEVDLSAWVRVDAHESHTLAALTTALPISIPYVAVWLTTAFFSDYNIPRLLRD